MLRTLSICGLVLSFAFLALAQDDSTSKGKISAETQLTAKIQKTIDAESSSIGEDVNFVLTSDVVGDGMKIPSGSEMYARIVNVEKISDSNKNSKISILFDFVQAGEDFMTLKAVIIGIEQMPEDVKFETSDTFDGGTVLSLRGKNLKIDEGKVFRVKLIKDLSP